jgi:glucose-1-phosphate thymidylyltransferase
VPVFEGKKIIRVEEKPANPASNYAVIGIYMYDYRVFEFIKSLQPSQRGELEITDVNNFYIKEEKMQWDILNGWWSDAGTFESLQSAGNMVAKTGANKI